MKDFLRILGDATSAAKDAVSSIPGSGTVDSASSAKFIATILNWVYAIAGLVAVIFIVMGGFNYVNSQGDPAKAKNAGQTIAFAIIGLIVVLVATAVTNLILSSIGSL